MLEKILNPVAQDKEHHPHLLVGHHTRDDAAVYDLGSGQALISTTDFFMPIVDDPYDFGRIAAVNAISDVYAMGGTPLMAIAILGWPLNKLPPEEAACVIDGGNQACRSAGIPLAGGHSIDAPEPVFGLAVTGIVKKNHIKRNSTALPGCNLYLTKPLGIGILTTAGKKGILSPEHAAVALCLMTKLNNLGTALGKVTGVTAMTDVTGFGLLGHLLEMCEGSGVHAIIRYEDVPSINGVEKYAEMGCIPGGTQRNWDSYVGKIGSITEEQRKVLCDPQTSGGLLIAVTDESEEEFLCIAGQYGYDLKPIGKLIQAINSDNIIKIE